MNILLVKPGEEPEVCSMPDDLQAIQRFLDGPVEAIQFPLDWAAILSNVNGPFREAALPNRIYKGKMLYGDFLVVGSARTRYKSLTPEQIVRYKDMFRLGGEPDA